MFERGLGGLTAYLQRRIDEKQLAQVLVVGENHSGRTSIARHVLNEYALLKKLVNPEHFLLPELGSVNSSPLEMHARWLGDMYRKGITLSQDLRARIRDELNRPVEELVKKGLGLLIFELCDEIAKLPAAAPRAVGVYLDDVPAGAEIIETATELFKGCQAIVVATGTVTANGDSAALQHFSQLEESGSGLVIHSNLLF